MLRVKIIKNAGKKYWDKYVGKIYPAKINRSAKGYILRMSKRKACILWGADEVEEVK
ncbi:MAG: hypothetical protein AB1478_02755 [Nitrospirota bacterium]